MTDCCEPKIDRRRSHKIRERSGEPTYIIRNRESPEHPDGMARMPVAYELMVLLIIVAKSKVLSSE